ncbi:hypothetical protein LSTR_LSTR006961, partial [Laodelphax striatellus]
SSTQPTAVMLRLLNFASLLCLTISCCYILLVAGNHDTSAANIADDIHVQEVNVGDTAVLTCRSNDDDHRFQFWLISTKELLGPKNEIDKHKYSYRVLSGELHIRNVSVKEHGVYTCICKHLSNNTMNVKSIELIVKQDWEQVYDNDHEVNYLNINFFQMYIKVSNFFKFIDSFHTNSFRILLLLGMVLLLGALVFVLLTLRNDRSTFFKDLEDEEPLNDDDEKAGASYERISSSTQYGQHRASVSTFDNVPLDRAFPKEFQTNAAIENV